MRTRYALHLFMGLFISTLIVNGQTFQGGFKQIKVAAVDQPTSIIFTDDSRLFVSERSGQIKIIQNGKTSKFYQLSKIPDGAGLHGLALDPQFGKGNNYVYMLYAGSGFEHIVRVTAKGNIAVKGSEKLIFKSKAVASPAGMAFGKDEKLYVSLPCGEDEKKAQDLSSLEGKVIRINSDGTIPSDNPFTGTETTRMIWAFGLQNPGTPQYDIASGKMFVSDNGNDLWEEINDISNGGQNYGWPVTEGFSTEAVFENPIHASAVSEKTLNAKSFNGTFYNPIASEYPAKYSGKYFFADNSKHTIGYIDPSNPTVRYTFATDLSADCNAFITGRDGNLYYMNSSGNAIYKLVYKGPGMIDYYFENKTIDSKSTVSSN